MPTTDSPRPNDHATTRTQFILTALLVALYAAVRLWRLTATCLWFDEIAERVYETAAQGQRAFLVLFTRDTQAK